MLSHSGMGDATHEVGEEDVSYLMTEIKDVDAVISGHAHDVFPGKVDPSIKTVDTEKAKLQDIMKNEEISTIIHTIGAGVGADFTVADAAYDKVVIMTDADTDGAHIQVLLLTFFYRYMRPLIEAGKVYIALPPLYKVSKGAGKKQVMEYAWTENELAEAIKKIGKGYILQRYKGLGEMNADQLWNR